MRGEEVLDRLGALVAQSLVQVEQREGAPRYRLLETVRAYAWERLEESGEVAAVCDRHLDWCLALADEAEPHLIGAAQVPWLARLETEHDNIRAALRWARAHGEAALALRLAGALWRFWHLHGHLSEGRAWLEELLEARGGPAGSAATRAQALEGAGVLAHVQGDFARAMALHAESLALCRALGDRRGAATALNSLGNVANAQGDYARAAARYAASLALRRELGEQRGIALALNNLGIVAQEQGDLARATTLLEESVALYRELGNASGMALVLHSLGDLARERGDAGTAAARYTESVARSAAAGDKWLLTYGLEGVAWMASRQGQPERAAQLFGAAAALRTVIGAPRAPAERAAYERDVADVRTAVGDDVFSTAWAVGEALSLEEAIALALQTSES